MAGTYDTEQQRMIDRIKCIVFREAHDAGAIFINRQWIADNTTQSGGKNHIGNALLIIQLKFLSIITFVQKEKKKRFLIEQLKLRVGNKRTQENHLVF